MVSAESTVARSAARRSDAADRVSFRRSAASTPGPVAPSGCRRTWHASAPPSGGRSCSTRSATRSASATSTVSTRVDSRSCARSSTQSITESGYRSGDVNGLEAKAPPPPGQRRQGRGRRRSHSPRGANGATWFATATGGPGQPELRSKFATASNRSVWFRFQARPQDVGRPLVVETGERRVAGLRHRCSGVSSTARLVAWNDDADGARTSRLEFTPTRHPDRPLLRRRRQGPDAGRHPTSRSDRGATASSPSRRDGWPTPGAAGRGQRPVAPGHRTIGAGGRGGRGARQRDRRRARRDRPRCHRATAALTVFPERPAEATGQRRARGPPGRRRRRSSSVVGTRDRVRIHNSAGTTHVLVDVVGYHVGRGGSGYRPVTPARVLDFAPRGRRTAQAVEPRRAPYGGRSPVAAVCRATRPPSSST